MDAQFTWIPVFKAVCDWLLEYEDKQDQLIDILKRCGIDKGLDDTDSSDQRFPLKVIDPFTFLCFFMKFGVEKRASYFEKLIKIAGLDCEIPTDFNGVPNAQAVKVWMFPFEKGRDEQMIPTLWEVFRKSRSNDIDDELIQRGLSIPSTGFTKLTQCLFYTNPELYFPIDAQTKPWLEKHGIPIPKSDWSEYKACLSQIKKHFDSSFYEISYEAWLENQNESDNVVREPVQNYSVKNVVRKNTLTDSPLNQILYGPPGTGKTYQTVNKALEILDPEFLGEHGENRALLNKRFSELKDQKRIGFVTFHQSFSYEDFVEGIKAETKGESLNYVVEDGIFKLMCLDASPELEKVSGDAVDVNGKTIWKMSLGNTKGEDANIYDYCISQNEVRLGYGNQVDFSGCNTRDAVIKRFQDWNPEIEDTEYRISAVHQFKNKMKVGDLVIITDGNLKFRAIGEIISDYKYFKFEDLNNYAQSRKVIWHRVYEKSLPYERIISKRFSQTTIYTPDRNAINFESLQDLLKPVVKGDNSIDGGDKEPHVLIIDEINRGNISSIFGELITLIEPSKRAGAEEALSVTLPYSKEKFAVPDNLYLIGTMNTADRSLALMDTALRRRFDFVEMMPQPELLEGVFVEGINVKQMLERMNQRIEVLYDREHTLGHAFFMPLKDDEKAAPRSEHDKLKALKSIFANKILPLLEEYFFEDWEKIRLVLGDNQKLGDAQRLQFITEVSEGYDSESLFGNAELDSYALGTEDVKVYVRNDKALDEIDAYKGIYA